MNKIQTNTSEGIDHVKVQEDERDDAQTAYGFDNDGLSHAPSIHPAHQPGNKMALLLKAWYTHEKKKKKISWKILR